MYRTSIIYINLHRTEKLIEKYYCRVISTPLLQFCKLFPACRTVALYVYIFVRLFHFFLSFPSFPSEAQYGCDKHLFVQTFLRKNTISYNTKKIFQNPFLSRRSWEWNFWINRGWFKGVVRSKIGFFKNWICESRHCFLPEQNPTKIGRDMGRPIQLAQNKIFVRLWLTWKAHIPSTSQNDNFCRILFG